MLVVISAELGSNPAVSILQLLRMEWKAAAPGKDGSPVSILGGTADPSSVPLGGRVVVLSGVPVGRVAVLSDVPPGRVPVPSGVASNPGRDCCPVWYTLLILTGVTGA